MKTRALLVVGAVTGAVAGAMANFLTGSDVKWSTCQSDGPLKPMTQA